MANLSNFEFDPHVYYQYISLSFGDSQNGSVHPLVINLIVAKSLNILNYYFFRINS